MIEFNFNLDEDTKVYEFESMGKQPSYLVFAKNIIEARYNEEAEQYAKEWTEIYNECKWRIKYLGRAREFYEQWAKETLEAYRGWN